MYFLFNHLRILINKNIEKRKKMYLQLKNVLFTVK